MEIILYVFLGILVAMGIGSLFMMLYAAWVIFIQDLDEMKEVDDGQT